LNGAIQRSIISQPQIAAKPVEGKAVGRHEAGYAGWKAMETISIGEL
jgi:hypothetical protein